MMRMVGGASMPIRFGSAGEKDGEGDWMDMEAHP